MSDLGVFKTDERKKLVFTLEFKEIDPKELEYYFRLSIGNLEYSFEGTQGDDGKVLFMIPPLDNIVKEEFPSGNYKAKFEVDGKGFHSQVWKDTVEINVAPKVSLEKMNEAVSSNTAVSIKSIESPEITTPGDKKLSPKERIAIKKLEKANAKDQKSDLAKMNREIDKKIKEDISGNVEEVEEKKESTKDVLSILPDWYK